MNGPLYDVAITHTPHGPRPTAAWVEGTHRHRRGGVAADVAFLEVLLDLLFGRGRGELWGRYQQLSTG